MGRLAPVRYPLAPGWCRRARHHLDDWYVVAGSHPSTKIDVRTEGAVGSTVEDGMDVHRLQSAVAAYPYLHTDH